MRYASNFHHAGSKRFVNLRAFVMIAATTVAVGSLAVMTVRAQQSAAADLLKGPTVKAVLDYAKTSEPQAIEDEIRLRIPAPSFKESARGEELKRVFQQLGLQNVRVDKAGNVLGDRPGLAPKPHFVLAAHLTRCSPKGPT